MKMEKVTGSSKQGRDGRLLGCNDQEMLQRLSEFPFWLVLLFVSLLGNLHSSASFSYCSHNMILFILFLQYES